MDKDQLLDELRNFYGTEAYHRACGIVNYGGCNEEYFLGWDFEEIEEAP